MNFEMLISNLSKEEKTVLTLYYCLDYTTKEIFEILILNESTIRTKIMRAKEKIRKDYEGGIYNG